MVAGAWLAKGAVPGAFDAIPSTFTVSRRRFDCIRRLISAGGSSASSLAIAITMLLELQQRGDPGAELQLFNSFKAGSILSRPLLVTQNEPAVVTNVSLKHPRSCWVAV
jgi:hypothetical protein